MDKLRCGAVAKFMVLKNEDIEKYLTEKEKRDLDELCHKITLGRKLNGKKNNEYLVINTDEPYSSDIIGIMKSNGHWG